MTKSQFYQVPDESGIDVRAGVPQSKAEKIFHYIADIGDQAVFDDQMAPYRKEMEDKVTRYVTNILEAEYKDMMKLAPYIKAMGEVGITPDDLARVQLTQYEDEYRFDERETVDHNKAGVIVNFINANPDLRTLYNEGRTVLKKEEWLV